MINNYICKNCTHFGVCKVNEKITVFDVSAKKQLGVNIKIETCENYKTEFEDEEE